MIEYKLLSRSTRSGTQAMMTQDKSKPRRRPKMWVYVVVFICLIASYFFFVRFEGENSRYCGPRASSREAKLRGEFISEVQLTPIDGTRNADAFRPKEAWIQMNYENFRSIPVKKQPAGISLCVRFDRDSSTDESITVVGSMNGTPFNPLHRSNKYGTTIELFPYPDHKIPEPDVEFPPEGVLGFTNRNGGKESRFRYLIKGSQTQGKWRL